MNWKELLTNEVKFAYKITERLMDMVDEGQLDWQPPIGSNWMTTGQLLKHLTESCGATFKGFITGNWGAPGGEAAPTPAVQSIAEFKKLLTADEQLALDLLARCSEDRLTNGLAPAPWDPGSEMKLGYRLLQMVNHHNQHKGQLFYYLKMQGKPVNTATLWG